MILANIEVVSQSQRNEVIHVDEVYICELCQLAYEPEEINGVRKLKTFQGYTVDLRLQQFRKVRVANYRNGVYEDRYIESVPFDSPKGKKLLTHMHEEVTR